MDNPQGPVNCEKAYPIDWMVDADMKIPATALNQKGNNTFFQL